VNECPVDIEHIDHINGMRRHQVLVESAFPTEATTMLNNLERRGNPWGMAAGKRAEWTTELDFAVTVLDGQIPAEVEYLFWVGCAGALEDRAKQTTKAVAQLLHDAGVKFAVLGPAETCTGDPARRLGNEFVYTTLAAQNIETLNGAGVANGTGKKVIASCAHCFNTIGREYPQLGGHYEVIHHTELLASLVADGTITPAGESGQKVTYHDPCFLGRHNKVFAPPRELIEALPGSQAQEMERSGNRSFCCGAGGARMWLEENTGTRINDTRATEALATGADVIATACPYCNVMLGDAVNAKKATGQARPDVEVIDVAQLLVRAVKLREQQAGENG
jgi:Fe-S oxidoreductase